VVADGCWGVLVLDSDNEAAGSDANGEDWGNVLIRGS
jgi:hypothetical protein